MAARWTIRHALMSLWFADLMNVTEEVTIHKPLHSDTYLHLDRKRQLISDCIKGPFVAAFKLQTGVSKRWVYEL